MQSGRNNPYDNDTYLADIASFADPGTFLNDSDAVTWETKGKPFEIRLSRATGGGGLRIDFHGKKMSLPEFLSCEAMANLDQLARSIAKSLTPKSDPLFLPTLAVRATDELQSSTEAEDARDAKELIHTLACGDDLPVKATQLVFISGEAGAGKTSLIKKLVTEKAKAFPSLTGSDKCLFLYIDAQGKSLTSIFDIMARTLQDLRADFTYQSIAPLTRNGLLIPIIDGFDELLGSGGYENAFSSLLSFLSHLNGLGTVIASARSAFFDYSNFLENAKRFSDSERGDLNYVIEMIKVQPWNDSQISAYFASYATSHNKPELIQRVGELRSNFGPGEHALLSKPFFCSRVAELLADDQNLEAGDDLLEALVNAFMRREEDKEPLLDTGAHMNLVCEIAKEMWWLEGQSLDLPTLQTIVELVGEEAKMRPRAIQPLTNKIAAYAFLTVETRTSESRPAYRFEHEVFYSYFLATVLGSILLKGGDELRRFLGRSVVTPELADYAIRIAARKHGEDFGETIITNICTQTPPSLAENLARENSGSLVAQILRRLPRLHPGQAFKNLIFAGSDLSGTELKDPYFEKCDFQEADLKGAAWLNPIFNFCYLRDVEVDCKSTRLVGAKLRVGEEIIGSILAINYSGPSRKRVSAPSQLADVLRSIQADTSSNDSSMYSKMVEDRIDILERILRKLERQFYIDRDELPKLWVSKGEEWAFVLNLLKDELMEEKIIATKGPTKTLLRLKYPPDRIRAHRQRGLEAAPPDINSFWLKLLDEQTLR